VRIAGNPVEIRTGYLQNTVCTSLRDVWCWWPFI